MHLVILFLVAIGVSSFLGTYQSQPTLDNAPSQSITKSSYRSEYLAKECPGGTAGQFSVCADEVISGGRGESGVSDKATMRECRYFANGTIDVPTMTVITAWVPVGSRLCIGDVAPKPGKASGDQLTAEEIELRDKFTALAKRPLASFKPGSEVEIDDQIEFNVQADTEIVSGTLLGRAAQIRFRPVSARWEISEGQRLSGFSRGYAFSVAGNHWARAYVSYQVDYKYSSDNWVIKAASWELESNKLAIAVIERERRTLLVG
jgi:hypothetical protein